MENKTKIILTAIGLSAIVVPAVFLFVVSSNKPTQTDTVSEGANRTIDKANIEREVNSNKQIQVAPTPSSVPPSLLPSPSPTTSPIIINESTPSSQ